MIFMSPPSGMPQDKRATTTYDPAGRSDIEILAAEPGPGELLTPSAVATQLFVDRRTVSRWAESGKLGSVRTPGGQRRYLHADVLAIMSRAYIDHQQQAAPLAAPADGDRGEARHPPETMDEELAEAVVAEAVAIALEAEASVAAEAVVWIAAALAAAVEKAAEAAERARDARAYAAEKARSLR